MSERPASVYQFKAHIYNLNHVWRRFQMGSDSSLAELRQAILCLFAFREDIPYVLKVGREGAGKADLATVTLREAVEALEKEKVPNKKKIFFQYEAPGDEAEVNAGDRPSEQDEEDFVGHDNLFIVISFEAELPAQEGESYPVCIAGERASPPGEVSGYGRYQWLINNLKIMGRARFLEALKRAGNPYDVRFIPLLESGFDPAVFEVDSINRCLLEIKKK